MIAFALVAIVAAVPTEEKKDLTAEEAIYYRTYGFYPRYVNEYKYLPSYSSYKYLPSSYGYKYLPSSYGSDYYGYDYPSYYDRSYLL